MRTFEKELGTETFEVQEKGERHGTRHKSERVASLKRTIDVEQRECGREREDVAGCADSKTH